MRVVKHLLLVPVFALLICASVIFFIFRTVCSLACGLISKIASVSFVFVGCLFVWKATVGPTGLSIVDGIPDHILESVLVVSFVVVAMLRLVDVVLIQGADDVLLGIGTYSEFSNQMTFAGRAKSD